MNKNLPRIADNSLVEISLKQSPKKRHFSLSTLLIEILMFLVTIVFLVPIWMTLVNSFNSQFDASYLHLSIPAKLHIENYLIVLRESSVLKGLFNGLLLAISSTIIIVLTSSMAAFYISRTDSKFAHAMFSIFIIGNVIPLAIVPTYYLVRLLQIRDTYLSLILVFSAAIIPFAIFLFTGFIKTIPRELDEAALIDGSSQFQVFSQIVLPLLKPITTTVTTFSFIWVWNDSQIQMYLSNSDKWTMPMTVYEFYGRFAQHWELVFGDVIVSMIPCLILYMFLQRYIIAGLTAGAVKG